MHNDKRVCSSMYFTIVVESDFDINALIIVLISCSLLLRLQMLRCFDIKSQAHD